MTHGIIGNSWYNRKKNKSVYCVDDSNYKNIGGDEYTGKKSPTNMLVKTFADINKLSNNHIQQRVVQIEKKNIAEIQNFIEKEILTDQDLPEEALDRALSGFNIEGLNYQEKEFHRIMN